MRRRHVLPFGAELVEGGTRFRLWAPQADAATLCLEDGSGTETPMAAEPDGWFALTTRAPPGTRYRYRVGGLEVPDPASRRQPEDVHGPSEVVDPEAYDWHDDGWRGRPWEDIVVYELHTGTFSKSGDFDGVRRHLDGLARLGVTALELMPVAEFPGARNWGYDGVLLFAPDARYGRPDDLKRLVEACHERGLCLLLDVVYNHFGPEGNYLHHYARRFFTERHKTPWGAAIDFSSRPVRDFYLHNALYWIEEFHIDGLRFDAVHAIADDTEPDIITEIAGTVRRQVTDRPVHLILENDKNQARYLDRRSGKALLHTAQWNDDVHHAVRVLLTGAAEGYYADYADHPAERLGRALAEGFAYQGEPSPYRDSEPRGEPSAQLPPTAFVAFIQNHDQVGNEAFGTRLSRKAAPEAIHAAATVYLLSPQIPMLFMGEEWGADQPFLFFCDFGSELADAVREGRRREFAKFPEFRDPAARERIPDPTAPATFEASVLDWAARERPPHDLWLSRYRRLLALRRAEIVPRLKGAAGHSGSWRTIGEKAIEASWRLGDGSRLVLVANFSERKLALEAPTAGRLLYSSAEPWREGEAAALSASYHLTG